MNFDTFLTIFKAIGLTPEQIVPLALFGVVLYLIFSKKLYKHLNPIKLAIVEIQSIFRINKFPIAHSLTETRESPLKPTEYGFKLFEESGLKERYLRTIKKFF